MKPLLHRTFRTKAELQALKDWTPAASHLTPEGRAEFNERMRERIARVQGIVYPSAQVHELKRKP